MSTVVDQELVMLVEINKREVTFFIQRGFFPKDITSLTVRRSDMVDPVLADRAPLGFARMAFDALERICRIDIHAQSLRVTIDDVLKGKDARDYLRVVARTIETLLAADRLTGLSYRSCTLVGESILSDARSVVYVDYPGSLYEGYTRQYRFSEAFTFPLDSEVNPGRVYELPRSVHAPLLQALADTGVVRSVRISGHDAWITTNCERHQRGHEDAVVVALKQAIGWGGDEAVKPKLYCPTLRVID